MIKKMTESVHNFAEGKSVTLNSGLNVREELGTSDQVFFLVSQIQLGVTLCHPNLVIQSH